MHRIIALLILAAFVGLKAGAQQVPDPNFRFENPSPAYEAGKGPVVCIDEAHFNFHTAEGRYKSFADLLRGDGYAVQPSKSAFSAESLVACRVMVIANASSEQNREDWASPHISSFTRDEIVAMFNWIRGGGALLLIADHSPFAGAAADLGAMLGAALVDGYAAVNPGSGGLPDAFSLANGGLRAHAITKGRNEKESVTEVGTFTGSAFMPSQDFQPLLVLPATAVNVFHWNQSLRQAAPPRREWPRFSVAGWSQGAARTLGKGRVVILGEAAMCSAQLGGPEKFTMGMNHPKAAQNAQFCLNVVRWLSGVLQAPALPGEASVRPPALTSPNERHRIKLMKHVTEVGRRQSEPSEEAQALWDAIDAVPEGAWIVLSADERRIVAHDMDIEKALKKAEVVGEQNGVLMKAQMRGKHIVVVIAG